MNTRNFEVLYTHQKLKKTKTWQDGCLKISCNGTKAVLFDDQGCSLEVFHIHLNKVYPGSEVECERYLISIGDEEITVVKGQASSVVSPGNSMQHGPASTVPAAIPDLRAKLGKRKRDAFRPNLPRPKQDHVISQSSQHFHRPLMVNTLARTNTHHLQKPTPFQSGDMNNFTPKSRHIQDSVPSSTQHGQNSSTLHVTDHGAMETQSFFPTQKRNRSELLSLFAGKNRVVSREEKQDNLSKETVVSFKQDFSILRDSTGSHEGTRKGCSRNSNSSNPFCQHFDTSFGDEDDFSNSAFQSLYEPKSNASASFTYTSDKSTFTKSNCFKNEQPDLKIGEFGLQATGDSDDDLIMVSKTFEEETSSHPSPYENREFGRLTLDCDDDSCDQLANCESVNKIRLDLDDHGEDEFAFRASFERDKPSEYALHETRTNQAVSYYQHENTDLRMFRTSCGSEKSLTGANFPSTDVELDPGFIDYDHQSVLGTTPSGNETFVSKETDNVPSTSSRFAGTRSISSRKVQYTPPLVPSVNTHASSSYQQDSKQSFSGELYFPSNAECSDSVTPTRNVTIPTKFSSSLDYKSVLKSALREHLNIILFQLAQQYHGILGKADICSSSDTLSDHKENVKGPSCSHGPAKLRAVKKDGPNKGRHFYTCPGSGPNQCKFFQWADESHRSSSSDSKVSLTSSDSIRVFFKSKGVYFYHNCLMERRAQMSSKFRGKKCFRKRYNVNCEKKSMYIVLSYKDGSSLYSKDDIWIISKTVNFDPKTTFIAKSLFYGPSSSGDLEIESVSGYSPSNWKSGDTVHAIWACNAGTELSCIQNLDDHATLQQMPLLPYLLNGGNHMHTVRHVLMSSVIKS